MAQTLHNNVFTKLAASLSNSATSISLLDGSDFPTPAVGDFYFATLVSISASTGKEDDWEIVKVTGKPATNTLTVTRGQEGTAARAWDTYTPCEIRITAGTVIMPDGDQNLSNKTITSSTLDDTVIGGTTAEAGSFTDLDATTVEATNVEVTNLKAKDGTTAGSIADSTGIVTLDSAVLTTADIDGGTVDGATIGQTTAALGTFTDMVADELQLTGGSGDQGTLSWNTDEDTVALVVSSGESLQLGQEVEYNVRNNSGSSIAKGVPVMITGTIGSSGRITIGEMDATSVANDKKYLGITAEAIASGADGKVMYFGKVSGLNTISYSAGDLLFLDTSVVGGLTATEPSSGIKLGAAYVVHSHASAGVLMVRPSASVGLHDLHDVFVDAPGTGEIIRYNATNGLWETKTLAEAGIATTTNFASTGIDDNASSTAITISSAGATTFSGNVILSEASPRLDFTDTDEADSLVNFSMAGSTMYVRARGGTSSHGDIRFQRNDNGSTHLNVFRTTAGGDVLFYDDDGSTEGMRWDSSVSKVGIGISSPAKTIDMQSTAPSVRFRDTSATTTITDLLTSGTNGHLFNMVLDAGNAGTSPSFLIKNYTTEIFRFTGTGRLGIGEPTPDEELHIKASVPTIKLEDGDGTNQFLRIFENNGQASVVARNNTSFGNTLFRRENGTNTYSILDLTANGDVDFYDNVGSNIGMRWDASAERLGIDDTSPASLLQVGNDTNANADAYITFGKRVASTESNLPFIGHDDPDGGGHNDLGIGVRSTNGTINFYTGNAAAFNSSNRRMTITSNGNVLIGRTVETLGGGNGDDLQIGSGGGGAGLTIHSATNSNGDIQFADGTTGNASYRGLIRYLHTQDALDFWTAGTQRIRIDSDGETSFFGGGVSLAKIGNIGPSTNSAIRISRTDSTVINGNPLGYLEFGSNDATGSADTSFAYVSAEAEGTFNDGDNPTALTFGVTADGTSSPSEVMRIHNSGNVGIGTDDPSDGKLQIAASNESGVFVKDSSSSNAAPYIRVQGSRSDANQSESFSGGLALEHHRTDAAVNNNKALGTIYFGGNHTDGSESNIAYGASIVGKAEGAFNSASDMPMGLAFFTGSTGTALGTANVDFGTERMRIDRYGDVELKTQYADLYFNGESGQAGISTTSGAAGGFLVRNIYGSSGVNFKNSGDVEIYSSSGSSIVGSMSIDTSGNVRIGNRTPASMAGGTSTNPILSIGGNDTSLNAVGDRVGSVAFLSSDLSYTNTFADGVAGEVACVTDTSTGGGNALTFYTGNTGLGRGERMRITSSGNVGIGEDNPARQLHVNSGSEQVTSIFESTGTSSYIDFANSTTAQGRSRIGAEGTDTLVFKTQGSERLRILAGGGITFNGDTAAANALDDYEEGTWNVYIYDAATGGNQSSAGANAYYTKIGRLVMVNFYGYNNINTSGLTSGNIAYFNLPFTVGSNGRAVGIVNHHGWTYGGSGSGRTAMIPRASQNQSRGYFTANGNGLSDTNVLVSDISSGVDDIVDFTFTYWTDS